MAEEEREEKEGSLVEETIKVKLPQCEQQDRHKNIRRPEIPKQNQLKPTYTRIHDSSNGKEQR